MYDFWFTLGYAAIKPALVGDVEKLADFQFVDRVVVEADDSGITTRRGPSTGRLIKGSTTAVRKKIASNLSAVPGVPPIGIYTAGRFCQMVSIDQFQSGGKNTKFRDIMILANTAYKATSNYTAKVNTFPALMGMCLMDGLFVTLILKFVGKKATKGEKTELKEILAEFGVTSTDSDDFKKLAKFVAQKEFKRAVSLLMGGNGDQNPWDEDGTTLEQLLFSDKSPYAIP